MVAVVAVAVMAVVEASLMDKYCGEMSVLAVLVVMLCRGCGGGGGELFCLARERDFRMCCGVLDRGEERQKQRTSNI